LAGTIAVIALSSLPSNASIATPTNTPISVLPCSDLRPNAVYSIKPLFLRLGAQSSFRLNAQEASPLVSFKHPRFDTVIDVGAFDGVDYTLPGFRAGYDVYSFEFAPSNQERLLHTLQNAGLVEGTHFSVIRPVPGAIPAFEKMPCPHVYVFFAGASSKNTGFAQRQNDASRNPETTEVGAASTSEGALPVLRLDDVVPADAAVFALKIDSQGHEPFVLEGSQALLAHGRVHMLVLEWWPAGIIKQGVADGGKAALRGLYDLGAECFDLRTHIGYIPLDRPSELGAWVDFLAAVPHSADRSAEGHFIGDPIGGWEDLVCMLNNGDKV
jgi:FkbM family methyltransferase